MFSKPAGRIKHTAEPVRYRRVDLIYFPQINSACFSWSSVCRRCDNDRNRESRPFTSAGPECWNANMNIPIMSSETLEIIQISASSSNFSQEAFFWHSFEFPPKKERKKNWSVIFYRRGLLCWWRERKNFLDIFRKWLRLMLSTINQAIRLVYQFMDV